jgi:hypothetical protein
MQHAQKQYRKTKDLCFNFFNKYKEEVKMFFGLCKWIFATFLLLYILRIFNQYLVLHIINGLYAMLLINIMLVLFYIARIYVDYILIKKQFAGATTLLLFLFATRITNNMLFCGFTINHIVCLVK